MAGRLVSHVAKVAVSAIALLLVLREVDTASLATVLGAADLGLVAAVLAIYLAGQALTAWRWRLIASRVCEEPPLADFVRWYFVGMFFNLFGPATLGGDVVRALFLGRATGRRAVALNTVVFDRLSGLVTLVLVVVAAFALFGRFGLPWPLVATVVAIGLSMTAGWFLVPALVRRLFAAEGRIGRLVERDLRPFWRDRQLLVRTALVSVVFHCVQIASLVLLGRAVSMPVDWPYYFVFHPLVAVLSALPVSVAGLGIREAGYVWFLERQGVTRDTAIAFGILVFAVMLAASLLGGLVHLWSGEAIPGLRRTRATPQAAPEEETQSPAAT